MIPWLLLCRMTVVCGSEEIVATVHEGSKHARDSVDLLRDRGMYRAGRVTRFLLHTALGCVPDFEHDTNIADVRLYAPVAGSHQAKKSSQAVGCPIFRSDLVHAHDGNLWPILKLAPVCIVLRHSGSLNVMVLHRVASYNLPELVSFSQVTGSRSHVYTRSQLTTTTYSVQLLLSGRYERCSSFEVIGFMAYCSLTLQ